MFWERPRISQEGLEVGSAAGTRRPRVQRSPEPPSFRLPGRLDSVGFNSPRLLGTCDAETAAGEELTGSKMGRGHVLGGAKAK